MNTKFKQTASSMCGVANGDGCLHQAESDVCVLSISTLIFIVILSGWLNVVRRSSVSIEIYAFINFRYYYFVTYSNH